MTREELKIIITEWLATARNPLDRWIDEEAYWTVRNCKDLIDYVPEDRVYIVKQLFDRVKYRKVEAT
jgi:hypothetical protein